jgi:hypothetical protein
MMAASDVLLACWLQLEHHAHTLCPAALLPLLLQVSVLREAALYYTLQTMLAAEESHKSCWHGKQSAGLHSYTEHPAAGGMIRQRTRDSCILQPTPYHPTLQVVQEGPIIVALVACLRVVHACAHVTVCVGGWVGGWVGVGVGVWVRVCWRGVGCWGGASRCPLVQACCRPHSSLLLLLLLLLVLPDVAIAADVTRWLLLVTAAVVTAGSASSSHSGSKPPAQYARAPQTGGTSLKMKRLTGSWDCTQA